jgi:hypothetical protein
MTLDYEITTGERAARSSKRWLLLSVIANIFALCVALLWLHVGRAMMDNTPTGKWYENLLVAVHILPFRVMFPRFFEFHAIGIFPLAALMMAILRSRRHLNLIVLAALLTVVCFVGTFVIGLSLAFYSWGPSGH